jgi:transposase, IS30 family
MVFHRGTKHNLITLRECKTRFLIVIKNESKKARTTAINIISAVSKYKDTFKSITFDQGSEFMRYDLVKSCLDASIYFCNPSSPYQKGSLENVNAVLRCHFPRSKDIKDIEEVFVKKVCREINNRPMKCLNYLTPLEVFSEYMP